VSRYNPPDDPDGKRAYDQQWDFEKAKSDYADQEYRPPREEVDKRDYDNQWSREKSKTDYRK